MDVLSQTVQLLIPYMGDERRNTWLALACQANRREVCDTIPQYGATADFVVNCVRSLLDHGCLGSRRELSELSGTDARRDLQKIAGCDGSLPSSEVISPRNVCRGEQ